jgi:hypothetical protein
MKTTQQATLTTARGQSETQTDCVENTIEALVHRAWQAAKKTGKVKKQNQTQQNKTSKVRKQNQAQQNKTSKVEKQI